MARDASEDLPANAGKPPPNNLEVEGVILSELLVNSGEAFDRVASILDAQMFWSDANKLIFNTIKEMHQDTMLVDVVSVTSRIKERGQLDKVGGSPYIVQLATETPAPGPFLEQHAKRLRDLWRRRQAISQARKIVEEGYGDVGDDQEWMESIEQQFSNLAHSTQERNVQPVGQLAADHLNKVWEARQEGRSLSGISTGFKKLDYIMSGLHPGDLYVIAGRPGMGKTSLLTSILMNISRPEEPDPDDDMFDNDQSKPALATVMFSLEQPGEQLSMRILCAESGASFSRLRQSHFHSDDYSKLVTGCNKLINVPMYIDDQAAISLLELRAKARQLQRQIQNGTAGVPATKLAAIGVDYMQLMQAEKLIRQRGSREQEVSSISQGLKNLAKELEVPVLALSQLNRAVEKREDKRPNLADLRESGAIEQDADAILFLYRKAYYDKQSTDNTCDVDIAKQRNGATGTVKVVFEPETTRFRNMTDEEALKSGDKPNVEEDNPDGHY